MVWKENQKVIQLCFKNNENDELKQNQWAVIGKIIVKLNVELGCPGSMITMLTSYPPIHSTQGSPQQKKGKTSQHFKQC